MAEGETTEINEQMISENGQFVEEEENDEITQLVNELIEAVKNDNLEIIKKFTETCKDINAVEDDIPFPIGLLTKLLFNFFQNYFFLTKTHFYSSCSR